MRKYADPQTRLVAVLLSAAAFLYASFGASRAGAADESADMPIERMIGSRLASDIDRALESNQVASIAVVGFLSVDANQFTLGGVNGTLPNEINRILRNALGNIRREDGLNKYRVMPAGQLGRRKQSAKLTIENIESLAAVREILGSGGADAYDAMMYGVLRKKSDSGGDKAVELDLKLLKMVKGTVVNVALNYDYRLASANGSRRGLMFLGENFPPLFVRLPGGNRLNNPNGLFGRNSEVRVYLRVNGERLPFYALDDPDAENQAVVKIPFGAEYEIELFDSLGARRRGPSGEPGTSGYLPGNRLFAAVLVDGLSTIGEWARGGQGPDDENFLYCDNPNSSMKWVLDGNGEDGADENGVPGKSYRIRGWQSSQSAGRRFVFTRGSDSLAQSTNQLSANLGVVTVAFFEEGGGKGGGGGTATGSSFDNKVTVIKARYLSEPKCIVNIRCIPEGDSYSGSDEGENLFAITK
ncbi:MAG: hypothetical protein LBU64_10695 [Planctomycetota bacterium]|jgi:hypothetical protein|nr:hypothetical protein [Planctomycetota bacterium]